MYHCTPFHAYICYTSPIMSLFKLCQMNPILCLTSASGINLQKILRIPKIHHEVPTFKPKRVFSQNCRLLLCLAFQNDGSKTMQLKLLSRPGTGPPVNWQPDVRQVCYDPATTFLPVSVVIWIQNWLAAMLKVPINWNNQLKHPAKPTRSCQVGF